MYKQLQFYTFSFIFFPLSSDFVGIESQPAVGFSNSYTLEQNYRNPFNPITNIKFQIPCLAGWQVNFEFVALKIYNLQGQEVATLVSVQLRSGSYKYEWDAAVLPSGVYFDHFTFEDFTRTIKMLLVR